MSLNALEESPAVFLKGKPVTVYQIVKTGLMSWTVQVAEILSLLAEMVLASTRGGSVMEDLIVEISLMRMCGSVGGADLVSSAAEVERNAFLREDDVTEDQTAGMEVTRRDVLLQTV